MFKLFIGRTLVPVGFDIFGRTIHDHFRDGQLNFREKSPSIAEKPGFQLRQPLVKDGPIHGRSIAFRRKSGADNLLAAETAGKTKVLSVRTGEGRRDTMCPADHQPVGIQPAKPLIVKRAHKLRPLAPGKQKTALLHIVFGPLHDAVQSGIVKGSDPLPQIGPFTVGVMEEIGITAIVRTSLTGQSDILRDLIVDRSHGLINFPYLTRKLGWQKEFFHEYFTALARFLEGLHLVGENLQCP